MAWEADIGGTTITERTCYLERKQEKAGSATTVAISGSGTSQLMPLLRLWGKWKQRHIQFDDKMKNDEREIADNLNVILKK